MVTNLVNLIIFPMNILRWRSFLLVLLLGLSGGLRLKAEAVPLPVVNPSFEALTGTDPAHFDASGHLLDEHYSAFNFAFGPGFNSPDALPGWSGSESAGTFNPTAALFPGGVPDGQNTAWINVHGSLNQTLAGKFQAGRHYRLTVDVGALSSVPFSGYVIGLYANGQPVAVDNNSKVVVAGRFATATVDVTLPAGSPAVGASIEVRLGIPGSTSGQTDFDNVRVTVEPPVGENIVLTATVPATAQPGPDFTVTFTLENQGTQAATGAALSVQLPTGFTLVTNTTSQGTSVGAGGVLLTVLGTLPGGGNAVVTLTGHSSAPASLVFHGQATRDGTDASLGDNQADAGVEVLGPCVSAPAGMVVQLRGDADLTEDFSHHVSATGIRYAEGKVGAAFLFDGSNQVGLEDSPELDGDTFTIETWVFPTVLDGAVNIIANKESGSQSYDFQYEVGIRGPVIDLPGTIPVGNVAFYLGGVTGLPDDYGGWIDGLAQAPIGRWTHVALAVSPGTATVYVDGKATRRLTGLGGSLRKTTGPLKVGARDDSFGARERFKGRIDEFSFYGRALTGAEIGSVFQAGSAGKCIPAYPPSIQAGPSDQTVSVGTDGRFSVVATGTGPLRYQWRFQDIDIAGATNAQLLLPKVGKSAAGKYSVAVCNAAGCAPVVSANLSVDAPVAVVRIGDATAKAPEPFSVPLLLVGNGDENAVGLSIRFDPRSLTFIGAEGGAGAGGSSTRLNSSQATNGAVGILIGLQSGARFPRGTNELVRLRFQPKVSAVEVVTPVQISDSPAKLQLADVDANALPVVWTDGNVRILATDFEGDVGPAPVGDRRVTAADWLLIGRYVAGLEVPANDSLFQRADCAPLSNGGNGRLTVGDWVQAGRFAVGLDPLMPANGPAAPVARTSASPGGGRALPQSPGARVLSISGGEFLAGQAKEISVRLAASGDENALAFSVRHDPTRLRFVGADLGADATGATLYINSLQGSDGRIGLVLALPASAKFVAGDIEVAKFRFAGLPGGTGPMDLSFSDAPVFREVASATAEALPSLWADTVFTVASRNLSFRVVPTADGPVIELSWPTGTTDVSIESATDPVGGKWSPVVAVPVNDGASRIVTLPLSATSSYYRLVVP